MKLYGGIATVMNKKIVFPQSGSLIFFGHIFGGRLGETDHQIVKYEYDENQRIFYMHFNEGEICTVYSPKGIKCDKYYFTIKDASRIIWEWYYGRRKTPDNLNSLDYERINARFASIQETGISATHFGTKLFKIKNQPAFQFVSPHLYSYITT
jgi:hypothetical protein